MGQAASEGGEPGGDATRRDEILGEGKEESRVETVGVGAGCGGAGVRVRGRLGVGFGSGGMGRFN